MKVIRYIKRFTCLALLFFFLATFYACIPAFASSVTSAEEVSTQPQLSESTKEPSPDQSGMPANPEDKSNNDDEYFDDNINGGKAVTIADPLEPFNRAMFHFNDKLYFWILKPVAQGYKEVVPEPARVSVKNFFSNLGFPIRFLSCLLQADFSGAATEAGRFGVNTIWGIGGLMDPAASKELDLQKQDTDLGLTLASYGVGHGFYIVWPVWGPSSPRDSIDIAGEYFLYPTSYITPWYYATGTRGVDIVNATSLRIGDYEAVKEAAIDHYVAMRDGYIQYRLKKIKEKSGKTQTIKSQKPDDK